MKKCITCGKIDKTAIITFLLLSAVILFSLLNDLIFGINYSNIFSEMSMINSFFGNESNRHRLIEASFNYLGILLFGTILYLLQKFVIKDRNRNKVKGLRKKLIYYNSKRLSRMNIYYLLILIIIWVVGENLIILFGELFKDLDFWFLELIFLSVMLNFFFGVPIYKHHLFSMILIISICATLKIINIILSFVFNDNSELYVMFWYMTIIGLIINLILIGIKTLYITGIKWFIDLKFVSHTILLIIYGAFGAVFSISFCIAATYIDCNKLYNDDIVGNICFIKSKENEKIYFLDNFFIYFKQLESQKNKLFLIIFGVITFFAFKYCYILTIKKYNPVYVLFTNPLVFFIEKILLMINTLAKKKTLFLESSYKKVNFFLDLSGDISFIIGFLIYLEVIVINCYGLNHNVKNNIAHRGIDNYRNIEFVDETGEFSLIVDDEST